jgi:hypothetical protein
MQANSGPLSLPHGENLEASGYMSTRLSIPPYMYRSELNSLSVDIYGQALAPKPRTNAISVCMVGASSGPTDQE